ncbi:MAG: uracil-DNA glycosylase [Treponema sp.]|nr:uracil-DNA glycosylase [Treponema sp.]
MKKEEKELIFNLLKSADTNLYGYRRAEFAEEPVFTDDIMADAPEAEKTAAMQPVQETQTPLPSGMTLEDVNAKIMRCTRCQLARTRNNVVPGQGVEQPLVLVIGEGPGADEDARGLPFVGKAGILLDKMLAAIRLDRKTNCYIANIVKCRPPENRNPLPEEQDACFSFLEAQIHILKPKIILCMGKIAAEKMLNQQIPITQYHGHFFEYQGIPLMPTYHPSALLRNEQLKRPAWEDLKGFRRKLDEIEGNTTGAQH